jgi:DNA/RNA-binding domain of Phe-tRNA-synthetase-like protein
MHIQASADWRTTFPGASVGCLLLHGVTNASGSPDLDAALAQLQTDLRHRYASADRAALARVPVVQAYQTHYRAFGQTYHVLRQLESVALKGRAVKSPGGSLVSAMFAAELSTLLLTAGHDVDALRPPLLVDCSRTGDRFIGINGEQRDPKQGDMLMRDADGIISAVLHGPDQRTRLSETTTRALFVTYAPAGVAPAEVRSHLDILADYVRLASPDAATTQSVILSS